MITLIDNVLYGISKIIPIIGMMIISGTYLASENMPMRDIRISLGLGFLFAAGFALYTIFMPEYKTQKQKDKEKQEALILENLQKLQEQLQFLIESNTKKAAFMIAENEVSAFSLEPEIRSSETEKLLVK